MKSWDNITVIPKAISNCSGKVTFAEREKLDESGILPREGEKGQSGPKTVLYTVETITVDEFWKASGSGSPQFMKVDVEGHEEEVFKGAVDLLRTCRPIVMFEALNHQCMRRNVEVLRDISRGNYEFARATREGELVALDSTNPNVTNNFFAIPQWGKERFSKIPRQS